MQEDKNKTSFSQKLKDELCKHISPARHCQISELSALYHFLCIKGLEKPEDYTNCIENDPALRKCFTLFKKTFNICNCFVNVDDSALKAMNSDLLFQKSCCVRAYLRGAFLAVGSMSDPEKSYHLEYVCQREADAVTISELLKKFDVDAKIFTRKNSYVTYIKDGTLIAQTLSIMEAHVALMEFENMRILKEMRNSVNRQVNCDTANIKKTISAAQKQIDEIRLLMSSKEYKELPDSLKEIASLRIEYPEASLTELGQMCDPPVGKSGVNHRLRKLGELALRIKEENYD